MNITTLRKNMNIDELDYMIFDTWVRGKILSLELEEQLVSDTNILTNVLLNNCEDDLYVFNSENHKLTLIAIDRKNRKERIVNIDEYRNVRMLYKHDLNRKELTFIASNL